MVLAIFLVRNILFRTLSPGCMKSKPLPKYCSQKRGLNAILGERLPLLRSQANCDREQLLRNSAMWEAAKKQPPPNKYDLFLQTQTIPPPSPQSPQPPQPPPHSTPLSPPRPTSGTHIYNFRPCSYWNPAQCTCSGSTATCPSGDDHDHDEINFQSSLLEFTHKAWRALGTQYFSSFT